MSHSRILRVFILICALFLMMACALPFSPGAKEPDIQRLQVAGTEPVDLDSGEFTLIENSGFYPSPDGSKIAVFTLDSVCIYAADGENLGCEVDKKHLARVDYNSVQWSPNGKQILFTEAFFRYMIDPDLWLLDVENLSLRNLTDDDVEGNALREKEALLDIFPQWIDGGRKIAFVRMQAQEDEPILCRIDPLKGAVEEGLSLPSKRLNDVTFSPDGKRYAFVIQEEPYWAVYAGNVEGGNPDLWFEADRPIYEIGFSADGKYLMIREFLPEKLNFNVAHLLETGNGAEVQTIEGDRDEVGSILLTKFAWSPAGSAFLYFEMDYKARELRLFAGKPGEEAREIEAWDDYPAGLTTLANENSLIQPWTSSNTLLLFDRAEKELLRITLTEK